MKALTLPLLLAWPSALSVDAHPYLGFALVGEASSDIE